MIGLDAKIETLRALFAARLFVDITDNTYVSYGRAFWNKKGEENRPEIQITSSKKYREVLPNHKIDGHSFFLPNSVIPYDENSLKAKVSIYFAVNLDSLYPTINERAVEYLHRDVIKIVRYTAFKFKEMTTDLDAFSDFGDIAEINNMEPFYLVRFDTEIEYLQECTN